MAPVDLTCAKCQTVRPMREMARVWSKDSWFPLCHPIGAQEPTCFDRYHQGHTLYGQPVTVLKDRRMGNE